jgi:hypothetical protein
LKAELCERWRTALQRRLAGAGAKPPCAALAEDRRGERQGKGVALIASGGDQEDVPEALDPGSPGAGVAVEASKTLDGIEIEVLVLPSR